MVKFSICFDLSLALPYFIFRLIFLSDFIVHEHSIKRIIKPTPNNCITFFIAVSLIHYNYKLLISHLLIDFIKQMYCKISCYHPNQCSFQRILSWGFISICLTGLIPSNGLPLPIKPHPEGHVLTIFLLLNENSYNAS